MLLLRAGVQFPLLFAQIYTSWSLQKDMLQYPEMKIQ